MSLTPIIETPRLILREFSEHDIEAVFAFRGDPEVMRFSVTGPETIDMIRTRFLPRCRERYAKDGCGQWAVVQKSDGVCVGECGICLQQVEGESEYEIGYRLHRDHWKKGLAAEAAAACRDYGFQKMGLKRLVSIIEAENAASIRVAERTGMTLEKRATFYQIPVLIYAMAA